MFLGVNFEYIQGLSYSLPHNRFWQVGIKLFINGKTVYRLVMHAGLYPLLPTPLLLIPPLFIIRFKNYGKNIIG